MKTIEQILALNIDEQRIYINSIDKNVPNNQQMLLSIANSNLPEDVTRYIILKSIEGVNITLSDIRSLSEREFAILLESNDLFTLLYTHSIFPKEIINLLNLVLSKFENNLSALINKKFGQIETTILHMAVVIGDIRVITKILELPEGKAALSIKNKYGETPLHYAASTNKKDVIAKMLEHKEGKEALHIEDNFRRNVLNTAIIFQHYDLAIMINEAIPEKHLFKILNSKSFGTNDTSLHLAVKKHQASLVKAIFNVANKLESHQRLEILTSRNSKGNTALDIATEYTRCPIDVIIVLLDNGAVPNLTTLAINSFSKEINQQMQNNYHNQISSTAHSVINNIYNGAEFIANVVNPSVNMPSNRQSNRFAEDYNVNARNSIDARSM